MTMATGKTTVWANSAVMTLASGRTMGYGRVTIPGSDLCTLYVSANRSPSDGDWVEYLAWYRKTVKPGIQIKTLVYERGSGPNAAQRKQLGDITAQCSLRVAVLTPSAVGRGVVTAMNWFKKDSYKSFLLDELDAAIAYLQITGVIAAEIKQTVRDTVREFDSSGG